ncbi:MAG: PAS domain-containing sensor histidine kinase [Bacteroidales bacterium]|nr:PAS domain-containing sensor histidine kinase [Bacteroidales bacterium]
MEIDQSSDTSEFLDFLPEIVFEIDTNLNVRFLNKSCKKVLGYEKEAFLNKPIPINKLVVSEDIPRLTQNIKNAFNGLPSSGNNYRIYNAKGEILTLEVYNSLIKTNGEISGLRTIAIDITKKEAKRQNLTTQEKHYRLIFQNSPIPYQSLDIQGKILDVNPAWEKILGYDKRDVLGIKFSNLLAIQHTKDFDIEYANFIEKGEINNIQFSLKNKSGSEILVNYNGKVEFSENNEFLRTHCVFNDITAQKLAEKTLKKSEKQLRDLNATKDKFFSIIAHDLKNPFNDLMGFSQLLDLNIEKYDNQKIKQFVNIIHQSSKLAYNLLENLLDWSRSQTGVLKFRPEKILINDLIKENIELLESTSKTKNLKILSDINDDFFAFADKNMIRTVIRNLISNAIKYTNPNGIIEIKISYLDNKCMIIISDNGIGISQNNIQKLFKIDESYSTPGTDKERGTGLGLILCKEFIEKNNGELWAKSTLGKGSDFIFTLPLNKKPR